MDPPSASAILLVGADLARRGLAMHPHVGDLPMFEFEHGTEAVRWLRDRPGEAAVAIIGAAVEAPLWTCHRLQAAGTVPILRVLAAEEAEVERLDRAIRRSPFLYGDRACLPADADLATTIGDAAHSATAPPGAPAPTSLFEESTLTLLEATPTATLVGDADDCVICASPQARALLGRPARWLDGRPLADAFVAGDQPQLAGYLQHCSASGELPISEVLCCLDEHGATHPVVLAGGLSQPGGTAGTKVLVVREATSEEAQASRGRDKEADGNEELHRVALEAAGVGTWHWDLASGEVQWSDNLEAMFGLAPGTFDGSFESYLDCCVHEADRDALIEAVQDALAGRPEFHMEHRFIDAKGTVGWMDCVGRMEFDRTGEPLRMTGICMDITSRKRAEELLRALAEAGTTLATSLIYESTLAQVADIVVPEWGDWCAIEVLEGDRLESTAISHVDPDKLEQARALRRAYPPRLDAASGAGYVVRTGECQCIPMIEEKDLRSIAVDERHLSMMQELGLRSAVIVPLIARGRTLGALTLVAAETRRCYRRSDLPHIQELARRCAFAVDNARLYRAAEQELDHRIRTEIELKRLNETLEQRVAERTAVAEHRATQLRGLAAELTQVEQRERRRLAQNLHDHHQQILVAARLQIGRLLHNGDDEEARERAADHLDQLLGEAIDSVRTVSRELSPGVLYNAGLSEALQWLIPHKRDEYGLEMHLEANPLADPESEEVAIFLYQAVRELLFNVVKHAGTNEAWVRMSPADGNRVRIQVEDQGNGLDPDRVDHEADNERFGLFGMRKRLALWDGEFKVDSTPGRGTRITLTVPRQGHGTASSTDGVTESSPNPTDARSAPPEALPCDSGGSGDAARDSFEGPPERSRRHGDHRARRQR